MEAECVQAVLRRVQGLGCEFQLVSMRWLVAHLTEEQLYPPVLPPRVRRRLVAGEPLAYEPTGLLLAFLDCL